MSKEKSIDGLSGPFCSLFGKRRETLSQQVWESCVASGKIKGASFAKCKLLNRVTRKNTECQFKFLFRINNKYYFGVCLNIVWGHIYTKKKIHENILILKSKFISDLKFKFTFVLCSSAPSPTKNNNNNKTGILNLDTHSFLSLVI